MTFRAVETLSSVALIVAEDTRHSRTLLDHYEIRTPVSAYHEHNEARETPRLIARLQSGESIALISDAGTPLLSDPGARLVRAAIDADISVIPIPGASALLSALVASGLLVDRFSFYGFLSRKGRERTQAVAEIVRSPLPVVLYESSNRVAETLNDLSVAGAGDRQVVIARELTKKFEEFRRGTVASLSAAFAETELRGEVVMIVAGAETVELDEETLREKVRVLKSGGASARDIIDRLTGELGVARNLAYRLAHE